MIPDWLQIIGGTFVACTIAVSALVVCELRGYSAPPSLEAVEFLRRMRDPDERKAEKRIQ